MSNQNVNSMLAGTILATALISLILILIFQNIRVGLICLVPNFIPAVMAFGLWGYLVGQVGLGASVVTAIAIGIIVDDTIHFLTRYLRSRRQGQASAEAVGATLGAVGPALVGHHRHSDSRLSGFLLVWIRTQLDTWHPGCDYDLLCAHCRPCATPRPADGH